MTPKKINFHKFSNLFLPLVLLTLGVALLLCSTLVIPSSLMEGITVGKRIWFHAATALFSLLVFLSSFFTKRGFRLSFAELLLACFVATVLLSYQFAVQPAPESLLFLLQLTLCWWLLRFSFCFYPLLAKISLFLFLLLQVLQIGWGLAQLYDFLPSQHYLFKTTGSFYNSGPYGGFIALALPPALYCWLHYRKTKRTLARFSACLFVLCLLVLPATMSRSAWIAALSGCCFVVCCTEGVRQKIKLYRHKKQRSFALLSLLLFMLLSMAFYAAFQIKTNSANGRLLMWKIGTTALKEAPLKAVGLGGFQAAYGKVQIAYFDQAEATDKERLVAGTPEYAFNEYLQIALEQGIVGLACFLSLLIFCIWQGLKHQQIAAAAALFALSIFAFSSYPYRLPDFPIVGVLLACLCLTDTDSEKKEAFASRKTKTFQRLFLASLVCVSALLARPQKNYYTAYKMWKELRPVFNTLAAEPQNREFDFLYSHLNHQPKFLFDYAQALHSNERYQAADAVYARALELSCDAMLYNMRAKNYQAMQAFAEAEHCLLQSLALLPERIYPYYLLTKLYSAPGNEQAEKWEKAAEQVLTKTPKVHSLAIDEMRMELRAERNKREQR